jgi:hypothetical protein
MTYTVVVADGGDTTLIVENPVFVPTIVEVITPGPMGPTGPRGEGLRIDAAVSNAASLPAVGTSGQSILDASTGVIYTWRAT